MNDEIIGAPSNCVHPHFPQNSMGAECWKTFETASYSSVVVSPLTQVVQLRENCDRKKERKSERANDWGVKSSSPSATNITNDKFCEKDRKTLLYNERRRRRRKRRKGKDARKIFMNTNSRAIF